MFQVRLYGDPILRKVAKTVTVFDQELKDLISEMAETMIEYDGVGLAAPQVGKSLQIVVIDTSRGEQPPIAIINPEITYKSKDTEVNEEGCLSFPDIHLNVPRSKIVSVNAVDENGKPFTIENADGLLARALQHEIDHLNAIMIIDYVSLLQRKMMSGKLKKLSTKNTDDEDEE
jgi:peptide deformylase